MMNGKKAGAKMKYKRGGEKLLSKMAKGGSMDMVDNFVEKMKYGGSAKMKSTKKPMAKKAGKMKK